MSFGSKLSSSRLVLRCFILLLVVVMAADSQSLRSGSEESVATPSGAGEAADQPSSAGGSTALAPESVLVAAPGGPDPAVPNHAKTLENLTKTGLAEHLLSPAKEKKVKSMRGVKTPFSALAAGLKETHDDLLSKRAQMHEQLSALRSQEKKIRRANTRVAKTVKKMTVAEIVAAASIKGMRQQDFKLLGNQEASASSAPSSGPG